MLWGLVIPMIPSLGLCLFEETLTALEEILSSPVDSDCDKSAATEVDCCC